MSKICILLLLGTVADQAKSWSGCIGKSTVSRPYYSSENECCPGWRHNGNQNCNIAICSPECQNRGTCVRPFECSCPKGYEGDICNGLSSCSHTSPCYPGKCSGSQCICSTNFYGSTCQIIRDSYKPEITKANSSFSYFSETKKEYAYKFMTYATNKSEIDFIWTNQKKFNRMNFHIDASIDSKYNFPDVPPLPKYIRNAQFGIVDARVEVEHLKLTGGSIHLAHSDSFVCGKPSDTNPIADRPLNCRLDNQTNIIALDSGDRYKLKFTVKTGGFRELIDGNGNYFKRDIYTGVQSQHFMEYRFDYDVPEHCTELGNCNQGEDKPLCLEKDITKGPIQLQWNGWSDNSLSGVRSYAVEFWKMEYSFDYGGLREPDILPNFNPSPQYITTILESSKINYLSYEPREPGVYSVILEVADRANNTRYARKIAIYDKTSEITVNTDHKLLATSASPESGYVWQTTPNSDSGRTTIITISWEKHFINKIHEIGHFLAKVLDYTPRLSDNIDRINYKKIEPRFDDLDGDRNKTAIPNINSIVLFETVDGTPSNLPPGGWKKVTPLKENDTFELNGVNIRDGDSRQVWVRAHDVMGNTKMDSTVIYFDHSPPQLFEPTFKPNVDDGVYPFSSRVIITAKDEGSGISIISFTFVESSAGVVTEQINVTKKEEQKRQCDAKPKDCYCIRKGECFMIDTTLDINNCWLKIPIHNVNIVQHKLEITVYNLAMLPTKRTYDIVDSLKGIREYHSPSNLTIRKTTDESLSISWIQAPTCYERAGILIRLFNPDNTTKDFKIHKDATTFDITGLSPTTNYWFELYTKYGSDSNFVLSSLPAVLKFATAEPSRGLAPGGVAGLSVGFILILVIVVIVLVFLGRTGRLQPAKARVTQGIRTVRNTIRVRSTSVRPGQNNRSHCTELDDDIYYYGKMEFKRDNSLVISRKDVSLESQLAEGKFAIIYLAKYYRGLDVQTVVAKVLKDDQNEENIMAMKAKINFYLDKVGHHKNVLDFIGSVEDDVRGPFMLLEYCDKGVLKDFLISCKDKITSDLEERLYRMTYGICLGMDYLASKRVVHRRLAVRNIFLNSLFEPKIAGFGPDPSGKEEGEERIPLKWTAPECMKTTINANELSDVFSFGIVLWEIFSLGDTPYPGFQSREVPTKLKQGYKMKKPELCDDAFYKIMLKCWHYDPNKRPGFADMKEQLAKLFHEGPSEDIYYRTNDFQIF